MNTDQKRVHRRALQRLRQRHPEEYAALLEEEIAKDGRWQRVRAPRSDALTPMPDTRRATSTP